MQEDSLTRRQFVSAAATVGGAVLMGGLSACASSEGGADLQSEADDVATSSGEGKGTSSAPDANQQAEASSSGGTENTDEATEGTATPLVLVFSRADENYNVGYIETGNTMVLAQFIQQKTRADLFELEPTTPYPADYQSCIDQALAERDNADRPAVAALPDLASHNTVFFGFPVWWGDIPMPVYTAIEALDWHGKTIAPFNTHEGSGSSGMFETLARVCEGAEVLGGLTVKGTTAQNQRDEAERLVDEWLEGLGQ